MHLSLIVCVGYYGELLERGIVKHFSLGNEGVLVCVISQKVVCNTQLLELIHK